MDLFIYFKSPLKVGRDELEDAINEGLEGHGEVTGGGAGAEGANIDVEITASSSKAAVDEVKAILRSYELPRDTVIVADGQRYSLYD